MQLKRILRLTNLGFVISFIAAMTIAGCGSSSSTAPSQVTVSTLAGSAIGLDGTGTAASFKNPTDITSDGTNLYVVDYASSTIRKIVIATGVVSTLAGSGTAGLEVGTGTAASFSSPSGITADGGNLYVTDGDTIRKIVIATRVVTTLAGSANTRGTADGSGTSATFNFPAGITTDGHSLFVADTNNGTIRKIQH